MGKNTKQLLTFLANVGDEMTRHFITLKCFLHSFLHSFPGWPWWWWLCAPHHILISIPAIIK